MKFENVPCLKWEVKGPIVFLTIVSITDKSHNAITDLYKLIKKLHDQVVEMDFIKVNVAFLAALISSFGTRWGDIHGNFAIVLGSKLLIG